MKIVFLCKLQSKYSWTAVIEHIYLQIVPCDASMTLKVNVFGKV